MSNKSHSILFVCLANICRSPAAQGTLLHLAKGTELEELIYVESCGLGDWHQGKLPDQRMREAAMQRGIALASRAQGIQPDFFYRFDYILAADHSVLNQLYDLASSPEHKAKIHLITKFSRSFPNEEIPDPYYEGQMSFDLVLDMLEDSCKGLLEELNKEQKNEQN